MKDMLILLAAAGMFMASATASADGRRLYAACAACHGTNGASKGEALPALAGQPRSTLIASMRAFKDGSRPATIMHQIARGFSDDEIAQIAEFLERQKPTQAAK